MPEILLVAATLLEATMLNSSRFPLVVTGIGAVNTAHALTQYLAAKPDDVSALYRRGVAYYNLKAFDKATADLRAYLERKPDDAAGWSC